MQLSVVTFFAYLSVVRGQNAADEPMVTAAPLVPTHENLKRHMALVREELLLQRAAATSATGESDYLNYCYGAPENEGICEQANVLYAPCQQYFGDASDTKYRECLCSSGWVAAIQECHWCALGFNIPDDDTGPGDTSACSSISASIAPIPSAVLASYSAWNASYTGYIPGGANGVSKQTGQSASRTSVATNPVSQSLLGISSNYFGLTGTETSVRTANGGGPAETSAPSQGTQTSPTSTAKVGSVGAKSWNCGVAAMFSVVVFSLTVLCVV